MGPGTPYQKPKTPRIWPIFLGPGQFIFYFLIFTIKFYSIFPLGGGGDGPRAPPPLATSLRGIIFAIFLLD